MKLEAIVLAAGNGDERAWNHIVTRFRPTVRAVARRHGLAVSAQEDVEQHTWLALVERIEHIHEPAAIGRWLASTARNLSVRELQARRREVLLDDMEAHLPHTDGAEAEHDAQLHELRVGALRAAVQRVPRRQRELLTLLCSDPAPSYEAVSAQLGMPVGSIGPTRARCIARLRRAPEVAGLMDDAAWPHRQTRQPRFGDQDLL